MSQPRGSDWRRRYAQRATTWRERQARLAAATRGIDWDPAGPYGPGIDGARYAPGWIEDGSDAPPGAVLLIRTRATSELIHGWNSYGEMQDWLASRGTTGSGGFVVPPPARQARCVAEETVLAHMLGHTADVGAIATYLPPWTWTSDVRYDLAAAMQQVTRTGRPAFAEDVARALEDRAASIPASQLPQYGGRACRWALLYLSRLDETPTTVEATRAAAMSLRTEDAQAVALAARRRPRPPGPRRTVPIVAEPRRTVPAADLRLPTPRF